MSHLLCGESFLWQIFCGESSMWRILWQPTGRAQRDNKKRSVYFTENSGYRSLKNRSCVTVFGSCSVTLTVGEPLGDVSGSANHDFRTSVTGISGEIDASNKKTKRLFVRVRTKRLCLYFVFSRPVKIV